MASLREVKEKFGWNTHRERLFGGFERGAIVFQRAGCKLLYLDGSFVTTKDYPNDYDVCWDPVGVKIASLDPVLLEFSNRRAAQKAKYRGEFFPAHFQAEPSSPFRKFLEFFQTDKTTGIPKGIIGIYL